MILTDAGPLIAILDRGEKHHKACVECLNEFTRPMVTTWPAFSALTVALTPEQP